ncbi:hypothetical protein RJ639_018181 [Escallonia herrerae]|uniref:Reverse transcriptase Ty1/copia-type domain-containing protein n=1 Tax=Escallonia herrerae TaxID=1293975 RepID=A0AA89AJE7_9ASTE|nr:hypothetical protein RJ639_018181 [Escallonia herrerae]
MVKGLPSIDQPDQLYEACLVEKQHRHSFPKESTSRAKVSLELIHTDVCGPIDLVSLGKNRYFLMFIDDYSRKTWVYFLKQKSEVEEEPIEPVTPLSPVSPTQSSPSSSSVDSPVKAGPQCTRSLKEIYDNLNHNQGMFCLFADTEPIDFDEASRSEKWRKAMNKEIGAIKKNDTWELTTFQLDKKLIGVKWVYKVKKNSKGEVKRYKARLVVKGYKQRAGIDYDEVFAPVARLETIRLLISLAALNKWKIHQIDVKLAFLNGFLDEEVYIEQPKGYVVRGHEDKVLRLKKAMYGLKQAPRAWNSRIDKYFQEKGFKK